MTQQAAVQTPPVPAQDPLTKFYWEGAKQNKLMILQCSNGHYIHWPRPICRFCQSIVLAPKEVSGRGTLYTYTVAYQAFHPYWADKLPYVYALVELEEQKGLKVVTNIVDCPEDKLQVGMPVEVVFTEVVPGVTLPLFKPV